MLTLIHTGLLLDSDTQRASPSLAQRHQGTTVAVGCAAAAFAAWLLAPVAFVLQPAPLVLIAAAGLYLALASAAGFFAAWLAQLTQPHTAPHTAARIARQALPAWLFFPCIALFCQQRSPVALPTAAIAAIALTLRLRPLFAQQRETATPPRVPAYLLPSLNGLPASDANLPQAALIAICAIAALACAFSHFLFSAVLLLALSLALPAWRWTAFSSGPAEFIGRPRVRYPLAMLALLLTILSISPVTFGSGFWPFTGHKHFTLYPAHSLGVRKGVDRDYVSIILFPPSAEKAHIIPPPPNSTTGATVSRYVVIPFDGAYWYFQPPSVGPGAHAHQAKGQPTAADIRSTSAYPLAMEAHQRLDAPIDLACCRAIDLTVTNADTRPGPIALHLTLADSSARQTFDLGRMTIRSSTVVPIHSNRPPVRETLRFSIPPSKTIDRFDRITVTYLPSGVRDHIGAKVSIESFTLRPR